MSNAVVLFSDSSRGDYIPRHFAESIDRNCVDTIKHGKQLDFLANANPYETEAYWDTWQIILDKLVITTDDEAVYVLHHDGDLWALNLEAMDDEEKRNFFGDEGVGI